jgi:hypothetical protein
MSPLGYVFAAGPVVKTQIEGEIQVFSGKMGTLKNRTMMAAVRSASALNSQGRKI